MCMNHLCTSRHNFANSAAEPSAINKIRYYSIYNLKNFIIHIGSYVPAGFLSAGTCTSEVLIHTIVLFFIPAI